MPTITREIQETYESITRPVVLDILREVLQITNLPADFPIIYNGDSATFKLVNTSIGGGNVLNSVYMPGTDKLYVDVVEETPESDMLTMQTLYPENRFIFQDADVNTLIKPAYTQQTIVMSMRMKFKDKPTAERWRNGVRRAISQLRQENVHSIRYHYPVPKEFLVVLHAIWKRREARAPYGQTFQEWLKLHFTSKATTITDQAGRNDLLVIREMQTMVLGWFDFTIPPAVEKPDDGSASHVVAFEYRFTFDKPISCVMRYPVMVHNQLLDDEMLLVGGDYDPESWLRAPAASRERFDAITDRFQTRAMDTLSYLRLPESDEWRPQYIPIGTTTLATLLLELEVENPQELLNLTEIPNFELYPEIEQYMRTQHRWLPLATESAVVITVYDGDAMIDPTRYEIDSDLNLRLLYEPNIRNTYRVRIGLVNDLSLMSQRAGEALRQNGVAALRILATLDPMLPNYTLLTVGVMKKVDYFDAVTRIKTTNRRYFNGSEIARASVGIFAITAQRKVDDGYREQQTETAE